MNPTTHTAALRRHSRHALRRLLTLCLLVGSCAVLLVPLGAAWT